MPKYGDPKYWDKRYKEQENNVFDWLENYAGVKPLIDELISKDSKVLVPGCGNAEFSEHMYDDGYHNIDNCDISSVVIEQMRARNKDRTQMRYDVMDMKAMSYPSNYYDLVVDKGAIDTLFCGDYPFYSAASMIREVQRVLKIGGHYMIISYGIPENRMPHLVRAHLSFDVQLYTIAPEEEEAKTGSTHYIYVCKKLANADEKSEKNWPGVEEELKAFDGMVYDEFNALLESNKLVTDVCSKVLEAIEKHKPNPPDTDEIEKAVNGVLGKIGQSVVLERKEVEDMCTQLVTNDPDEIATIVKKTLTAKKLQLEATLESNRH
eukprot:TRINITY_DN1893_c0_g2_i2.p1 TRINITY_DN1893_c0_g2~~TRINITY_DN1893_c0_g2_i2.p1  ORF type:complete len:321 (-),score=84.94 TRINITY_DN1893_c0_g2_i2:125-1087(-)